MSTASLFFLLMSFTNHPHRRMLCACFARFFFRMHKYRGCEQSSSKHGTLWILSTTSSFTHNIKEKSSTLSNTALDILVNKCDNASGTCDHLYGKWHINIAKFGRFTVYSVTTNTLLPWLRIYSFKNDICNSDNASI